MRPMLYLREVCLDVFVFVCSSCGEINHYIVYAYYAINS